MNMTEKEIVRNYQQAKNKKQQIEILADLNETSKDIIKDILKDHGIDMRSANIGNRKSAIINKDFDDEINKTIKELPVIEAADPVPGEVGYKDPEPVKQPPLGLTPRRLAEAIFNETRIKDIIAAMDRYYAENMAIPEEWRQELKERL